MADLDKALGHASKCTTRTKQAPIPAAQPSQIVAEPAPAEADESEPPAADFEPTLSLYDPSHLAAMRATEEVA